MNRDRRRSAVAALACTVMVAGLVIGFGQRHAGAAVGDPVSPTMVKDIRVGSKPSTPAFFVQKGNDVFFLTFNDTATNGLWKTDGTAAGTVLVKAVGTAGLLLNGQTPTARMTLVGDTLYFTADDPAAGIELWKSDGTAAGTMMVSDVDPTPGYTSLPTNFTAFGDKLLFKTTYHQVSGSELWVSDGTEAGTFMLKDINPGSADSAPADVTVIGGTAYFSATDGTAHGRELWKTDGTEAGTVLVKDIDTEAVFGTPQSSSPSNFAVLGGTLYFSATDGGDPSLGHHGSELWKTDGTDAGTVMVKEINPNTFSQPFFGLRASGSSPTGLTVVGSTILFAADNGSVGNELWKTDGTDTGTVLVKDINTTGATASSSAGVFTVFGDATYFVANDGTHGRELWKSDGTSDGTVLLKDIYPGTNTSSAGTNGSFFGVPEYAVGGSKMYFPADDGTHGIELWETDGTEAGTLLVKDTNAAGSSVPGTLAPALGTVFYSADDGVHGDEPWVLGPTPPPTLAVGDVAVTEGDTGTTTATFTVTRSGATNLGSTVNYKTTNGSAAAGSDYTAVPLTSIGFAPGETSKTVSVDVAGDTLPEANETFNLVLSVPVAATIADASGVATIVNDDGSAYLSVADTSASEGGQATFTVARSGNTSGASTVKYKVAGGTATANTDYTVPAPGTFNFAAGETSKTLAVDTIDDAIDEPNETMNLVLSVPVGATLSDSSGTATIVDDDGVANPPAPATFLTVGDLSMPEGDSGSSPATVTVTRSGDTSGSSTVKYRTTGGTATAGTDYTTVPLTTLTFGPGETAETVDVGVLGDDLPEANETVNVVLSMPTGATISDSAGTVIIVNDDGVAALTIDNVSVVEGNSNTTAATFTVTRSGNTNGASTVTYKTNGGTATAGTDYTAVTTGSLTFAAGETSKTLSVDVVGDTTVEKDETFNVVLSAPVGAVISDSAGTATILNDD